MRLEAQVAAAVLLDLALGDPRWLPHPVRGIGRLAGWLEPLTRRWLRHERTAGVVAAGTVVAVAGLGAWAVVELGRRLHPLAGDLLSVVVIYTTVAGRDLAGHSLWVLGALRRGDLAEARRRVGWLVGRDTDRLDEAGVARAGVESVAESTVDGVTAPLFYALLAGPVGAMVYRAINTLDSLFGHQDERYARFGWAAARLDDLANYLPARLTAPLLCLAAAVVGGQPLAALRVWWRDGRRHPSPNAGQTEAAMAGALGLQLGGRSYYGGEPIDKPTLGDPREEPAPRHLLQATVLMVLTALLFLAAGMAAHWGLSELWEAWRAGG